VRIPVWFVAAVVVVVSLLTGVVAGIAVDRRALIHRGPYIVSRGGHFHGPMVPGRMERELGLSPAQSAAVDSVMHHRMAQRDSLMARTFPVMRALLDSTRIDIERVLTPDQRTKFEKMRFHDGPMGSTRGQRVMIGGPDGPPPPPGSPQ
jgi:Spy/CpxP family protein refolding chaperone